MHANPTAVIHFRAPDVILSVHSGPSYMFTGNGQSRTGGYFFLESMPQNGKPIHLNGIITITCMILKLVAASAVEAEFSALVVTQKKHK